MLFWQTSTVEKQLSRLNARSLARLLYDGARSSSSNSGGGDSKRKRARGDQSNERALASLCIAVAAAFQRWAALEMLSVEF